MARGESLRADAVEPRGLEQYAGQVGRLGGLGRGVARTDLRDLEAGVTGQVFHRIGKGLARIFHQKPDGGAVRAAAEAVIELLGRTDRERRRLLGMEGAAGGVVSARFFQGHVAVDDRNDVDPGQQRLNKIVRNHCLIAVGHAVPELGAVR